MHRFIPVILVAAASVALMAQADQMPKRKAGLWEMTKTVTGVAVPPVKTCVDAATDAAMYSLGLDQIKKNCSKRDIKSDGTTVTTDAVCTSGTTQVTTHSTTTFTGDTAYHTEADTHFDPPFMGQTAASMKEDGKWVGPCPSDMQPGDMVGPGGQKVNMRTLLGQ